MYSNEQNRDVFKKIATSTMPFGKYAGTKLINLPEEYLLWFKEKGFPEEEIGMLMQAVLEIKLNGLEYLFIDKRANLI